MTERNIDDRPDEGYTPGTTHAEYGAGNPRLRITNGEDRTEFAIETESVRIGSAEGNELRIAGIDLDAGAESFATRGGVVAALAAELGLDVVTPRPGPAWVQRARGGAVPLPAAGLLGIPADLDAPDVARALGERGAIEHRRAQLQGARLAVAENVHGVELGVLGQPVADLLQPIDVGVDSHDVEHAPIGLGLLLQQGDQAVCVVDAAIDEGDLMTRGAGLCLGRARDAVALHLVRDQQRVLGRLRRGLIGLPQRPRQHRLGVCREQHARLQLLDQEALRRQ